LFSLIFLCSYGFVVLEVYLKSEGGFDGIDMVQRYSKWFKIVVEHVATSTLTHKGLVDLTFALFQVFGLDTGITLVKKY
jgi:hypothetical protein